MGKNVDFEQSNDRAQRAKRFAAAAGLCAGLIAPSAGAFQPLITDDTGTQGAGGNQLEAAYNHTEDKAPGVKDRTRELGLTYTRGVTDALDLYLGLSHLRVAPQDAPAESGLGNVAFGAKWRFYENEAAKLSIALKPEVLAPVSKAREARGLGTAEFSYGASLLVTQETGFGAVHANLAVDRVRYDDPGLNAAERRTLLRASIAPVWDVTEHWKLALDVGVMTNPDREARSTMGYVEIGTIYSPSKSLDLALGIVRNVRDGDARTTLVTAGVTVRF
jgi:hypothetical protein